MRLINLALSVIIKVILMDTPVVEPPSQQNQVNLCSKQIHLLYKVVRFK